MKGTMCFEYIVFNADYFHFTTLTLHFTKSDKIAIFVSQNLSNIRNFVYGSILSRGYGAGDYIYHT